MEGIQVSTEVAGSRNHISIIKVGGYIDTTTSSELERALDSLLKQGRFFLVVDLGNVDYISSAGWGIFISEIKSIRENNGDLKLVRMVPDVYEIFELLEFHHILDVYDSVDEAINKFEVLESAGKPVAKEMTFESRPAQAPVTPVAESSAPTAESAVDTAVSPAVAVDASPEPVAKSNLPLPEKIKSIVKSHPEYGAFKIKRELNTVEYGFTKVSWFNVRGELGTLGLNNKTKRIQFVTRTL
jgi:anti-sigma B factor antagonist